MKLGLLQFDSVEGKQCDRSDQFDEGKVFLKRMKGEVF